MKMPNKYLYIILPFLFAFAALLYSKNDNVFPHKAHFDYDIECKACHSKAAASQRAGDNNLPDTGVCTEECHDKAVLSSTRFFKSAPQFKIEFNHQMHVDQDLKCTECHNAVNNTGFKPGSAFPSMDICYKCHDDETASKTCALCHSGKVLFPHKVHLDNQLDCKECHNNITKSVSTDNGKDIPGEKICNDCHEEATGYHAVTEFPYKQAYKFNHKLHMDQGLSCKDCHEALYKNKIVSQSGVVPKMEFCFECHDNATASQHCMLCHINPTKPKDHLTDWNNLHKIKANNNLKECTACHKSDSFCLNCHKGVIKPKTHHPNFELKHHEAGTRLKDCNACHSERQCRNCHISKGVTNKGITSKAIHPQGWNIPSSPSFHKRKARLRLSSCTACHTKKDCWGCHNPNFIGPRKR